MKRLMAIVLSASLFTGVLAPTALAYSGADTASVIVQTEQEMESDPDMRVLLDGYDVSTGESETATSSKPQTGTVVSGITSLHFRTGPGMDYAVIGYLCPGDAVEVLGKSGDWYKVAHNGKTGYVHGKYLTMQGDGSQKSGAESELPDAVTDKTNSATKDSALTPDGNLTLVDDIGTASGAGQQFITLVTKAGNTFYLIIDRNEKGEENVHFLNLVDESDLLTLMDEDEAAEYQQKKEAEAATSAAPETPAKTEESAPTAEPETEEKNSALPAVMLLLFVVGVGGVGGYLYFKLKGGLPKKQVNKPDPDANYRDEDEEIALPEEAEDPDEDDGYDEEVDEDDDANNEPV